MALPDLDILYTTRVQKERFFNEEDYVRMKDFYVGQTEKWSLPRYVYHLPRVNEISVEVILIHVPLISNRSSMVCMSVWP